MLEILSTWKSPVVRPESARRDASQSIPTMQRLTDSPYSIYSRRHIPQAGPTGTVVVVEGRGLFLQLIGTSFPVTLSAVISEYCGSRFGTRLGSQWEAGPYTRSYSLTHQARKAAGQQGCIRVGGLSGKEGHD